MSCGNLTPLQKKEAIRVAAHGVAPERLLGQTFFVRKKCGCGRWRVSAIDVACKFEPRAVKVKGCRASGRPWWVPLAALEVR